MGRCRCRRGRGRGDGLVASGGGTKGGIPYLASYTVEELRVGVEAAHALERPTVAHARATSSIENCLYAGVDVIAHVEFLNPGEIVDMGNAGAPTGLPRLDRRVADRLAESAAFLDLNPQSSGWDTVVLLRAKPWLTHQEADQLSKLERYVEHFLPVIGGLRDLGLADRMGFGSDAGPFDTEFGHLEYNVHLARLAGLTPMESLQAVTRNAARLCGLADTVGSGDSTITRRSLERTALSVAQCEKILAETIDGEAQLAEGEGRARLRKTKRDLGQVHCCCGVICDALC